MSRVDVFLERSTSVGQLILVGVAIYTLYFTAIPLYQKELASEQLAKIQIEQMVAEERLGFINASYELQLDESERMRKQNELLASRLKLEQQHLAGIQLQIDKKDEELNILRLALHKTSESVRLAEAKLAGVGRLKFIQAVEWYALQYQISRDCDLAVTNRRYSGKTDKGKDDKSRCDPLSSITSAIHSASLPSAKDQSGDLLGLSKFEADRWSKQAMKLVSEHKGALTDVLDSSRFKDLIGEVNRYESDASLKKNPESHVRSMNAALALISYGSEVSSGRIKLIGDFVDLLKARL